MITIEQRDRRHDHSRGAVRALQRAFFEKRFLQGVELLAPGQTLDGCDSGLSNSADLGYAGPRGSPINQDGAGAALAFAAAVLGPSEVKVVA